MKINLSLLLANTFICFLFSLFPTWADNFAFGDSKFDPTQSNRSTFFNRITTDQEGNIYVTGAGGGVQGDTFDIDPNPANEVLVDMEGELFIIAKYSPEGELIWHRRLSNEEGIAPKAIEIDPNNQNVVIIGSFFEETDFDPGPGTAILNPSSYTGFMLRLDNNGNFIGVTQLGKTMAPGDTGNILPEDLMFDFNGNILITGTYFYSVDFDPGLLQANRTSGGSGDMFVLKLSSNGTFLWVHTTIGDDGVEGPSQYAKGITVDNNNNIYVAGIFNSTVNFDEDQVGFELASANDSADIFILKLNSNGDGVWVNKIGGPLDEKVASIVCDHANNIVFGGVFEEMVDFDPNGAGGVMASAGGTDIFVAKWNANGGFVWAKRIGSPYDDTLVDLNLYRSIFLPPPGGENIYFTGKMYTTVDFDPGPGTNNVAVFGPYVAGLKGNGNFLWAQALLAEGLKTRAEAITVDKNGAPITVGAFQNSIDLEPGIGLAKFTRTQSNWGNVGLYCVKLDGKTGLLRANSAKFDASFDTDIILQDQLTGTRRIWLMDGDQVLQSGVNLQTNVSSSTNLQIAGVGDFNKDLQSDVVMQNMATGERQIWLLNPASGNQVTAKSSVSLGIVDPSWKIAAVGEFNNDGHTDLVWQNTNGICVIWYMYRTTPYDDVFVTSLPPEWKVVGTGWFDYGNENTDLIWQNKITKERVIWTMDGAEPIEAYSFNSSGNWEFVGSGFFNDDKRSDLILENKGTQQRTIWYVLDSAVWANITIQSASPLPNYPAQWEVRNR